MIEKQQLTLYAVSDRNWLKEGETLASVTETLLAAGVTCVQLREKNRSDEEILRQAQELLPVCRRHGVPLIINDRPDLAKQVGADGVHVGLSDMGIEKAREYLGAGYIIGGSAHNVEEALAAQKAGADYIGCGAVFGSATKTNVTQLPYAELKAICSAVSIPVVAIGGISLENVDQLAGTGIDGVAVVSALFAAEDKAQAVQQMLDKLAKQSR
jgi:thiamine-phosphate pyrophosphorylase